mmetsp:Transcript_7500/g.9118  ORF Transcript_7500/g.9118 Transcript_7500/m.9118 type:complete len:208 (+) Transcript_7500:138-761(+)
MLRRKRQKARDLIREKVKKGLKEQEEELKRKLEAGRRRRSIKKPVSSSSRNKEEKRNITTVENKSTTTNLNEAKISNLEINPPMLPDSQMTAATTKEISLLTEDISLSSSSSSSSSRSSSPAKSTRTTKASTTTKTTPSLLEGKVPLSAKDLVLIVKVQRKFKKILQRGRERLRNKALQMREEAERALLKKLRTPKPRRNSIKNLHQ